MSVWMRAMLLVGLACAAAVLAADQFVRGHPIGGVILGGVLAVGAIQWALRSRVDPAAGVDPWAFFWFAIAVAHSRAGWLFD